MHKVKAKEVIQTSQYTYVLAAENNTEYWMAISKDEVEVGEELFYFNASVTPMENFHSKELERDFDKILFISKVSRESSSAGMSSAMSDAGNPHAGMTMSNEPAHSGRKQSDAEADIKVEKAQGGITIAELYESPKGFAGKKVKISGVVVKVNNQIMGRNWVHIQDGTKFGEDYDLTFTTQDVVTLNDVVIIEGEVAIDKDFTSGYFYPVIVEDAKVVN